MSFLDSFVVQLRDYVNGPTEIIVQKDTFYKNRPSGTDYMPPFSIANVNHCQGNVSVIEGENPIDFYILAVDEIGSFDHEFAKDRSWFLREDFYSYEDFHGEILADGLLMPNKTTQILRKYQY